MACSEVPIQTILGTECIGDSLPKIMGNFNTLGDATCDLITDVNALSAYTGNLLSLLQSVSAALTTQTNTLSTNMQNIGNYPYLEYAWVCAPSEASQTISANLSATLTLTTEIADTGNYGNISANQISLSAGTYQYEAKTTWSSYGNNPQGVFGLYNATAGRFISRSGNYSPGGSGGWNELKGQFTISVNSTVYLILHQDDAVYIINGTYYNATQSSVNNTQLDQRTTIKLWKVG